MLVVKAAADTYVRTDLDIRRNDNYGLQDFIEVGTGRGGDGKPFGAPDQMRGLVRFDLSMLPPLKLTGAVADLTLQSYDDGLPTSVYTVDAHAVLAPWVEGNGFEGARPPAAPASLTDPDSAFGVAWAGADLNPDPAAANNTTQPPFDASVAATQFVRQAVNGVGDIFQWDVTPIANIWLRSSLTNSGIMFTDVTSDGSFRGARFGSRDGEVYHLAVATAGPHLTLSWTAGTEPGDLTGDGCVDTADLALLLAVVRGQATAGTALQSKLDLNGDGRIDIADARKLATLFTSPLGAPCR